MMITIPSCNDRDNYHIKYPSEKKHGLVLLSKKHHLHYWMMKEDWAPTLNYHHKTKNIRCLRCQAKQLHWKFIHDPNRHQEDSGRFFLKSWEPLGNTDLGIGWGFMMEYYIDDDGIYKFTIDNIIWDRCVSKVGDTTSIYGNLNRKNDDEHWILAYPIFGDDTPKLFDCLQTYQ